VLLPCVCADATAGSDAASAALRGFTYQAIGQAACRAPDLFRGDASVAARLFAALRSEPAGVRASLQEALGQLASAYRGCTGAHLSLL
jgi:proteasome component ECM29